MSLQGSLRIQQVLANAGVASRRHSEQLIREGRITLSGQPITTLGFKIRSDQYRDLRIDGQRLPSSPEKKVYVLLYKPDGFISSTSDPQGRPTVLNLLPSGLPRLYPVGRLDFHTEGLVLLTNDGALTQSLLHPRFHVAKLYEVKVKGVPQPSDLRLLCEGIGKDKERMVAVRAEVLRKGIQNAWLQMEIEQGRYHQVRRMCERIGHPVQKLKRVSLGPIKLGKLRPGQWRFLSREEVAQLKGMAARAPEPPKKRCIK